MSDGRAEVEGCADIGTPSTAPDAQDAVIVWDSGDDTSDGDDDYDDTEITEVEEEEESTEGDSDEDAGDDTEYSDGGLSDAEGSDDGDDECDLDDNDYSFFDDYEEQLVAENDLEAADMYMRRTANTLRSVAIDLQVKLENACDAIERLEIKKGLLMDRTLELMKANKELQKGRDAAARVVELTEENKGLKQELEQTKQHYMELQSSVQSFIRTQDDLESADTIELLGVQVTLRGNKVVKHDVFDIEPLLNEAKNNEATTNRLLQRIEQLTGEINSHNKNEQSLKHTNRELEGAKQVLEQQLAQFSPRLNDTNRELADQRQVNNQLEQRNRQLEEQLRRVNVCVGSALGTGEQTLMERARGIAGVLNRAPESVTLSVTHL